MSAGGDPAALLPVAVDHHEQGRLAPARELYRQIIALDPVHGDALQYFGILCHQEGDPQQAEALIRRAIAVDPRVALYHENLGTVLEGCGRLEEALAAYQVANTLQPGDADRHYNMGVVLERLDRLDEAQDHYARALESRPDDVDCRLHLGNVLRRRGNLEQAAEAYRMVLRLQPRHVGARVNLGNLLQSTGRIDDALTQFRLALEQAPGDATVHHNLGCALRSVGQANEALACFEEAVRLAPERVYARLGLAQALEESGRLESALAAYRTACDGPEAPPAAGAGLLRVARVHPPRGHDPLLVAHLLDAVASGAPVAGLARVLGTQLAARAGLFERPPADDGEALARALDLSGDALFRTLLEGTFNVIPEVERWLRAARRGLLLRGAENQAWNPALARTLALQGAHNDFVLPRAPEEERALAALRARAESWLAGGGSSSAGTAGDPAGGITALLTLACYQSLDDLNARPALLARDAWGEYLDPVLQCTVREAEEERRTAAHLPALGDIADPVSQVVREQYEASPYPRWRELPPAGPVARDDPLAVALAAAAEPALLVAGCGTGAEVLSLARRHPGVPVTGLDLSRSSLAYAARMASRLGVGEADFVHGDLRDAPRLARTFTGITASGVLHHLERPLDGWRALLGCLAPGGVMRVALYSRAARAPVNAARERIRSLGLPADPGAVRSLRARVFDGLEPGLEVLLQSTDFYTTSTCRDLLFHPVEHQFDLQEIGAMLDSLGLAFLGFELPYPGLLQQFQAAALGALDDLDAWHRFESGHPGAFAAMYVFWCARAAG